MIICERKQPSFPFGCILTWLIVKLPSFLRRRVATESAQTGPSIRIPYTTPALGAKYGEPITDPDRTFAIKREPVAHRIVFSVAHDIFDNWFDVWTRAL